MVHCSRAQYLQSDIAFKHIVGFLKFETGGLDRNSVTGISHHYFKLQIYSHLPFISAIVYFHVYLNRRTTAAHQIVLERINNLIESNRGSYLKWQHLHAGSLTDFVGILHWVGDQHGGQVKDELHSD